MSEAEAVSEATKIARKHHFGYAIEYPTGWVASDRKPSIRSGKVIEIEDGCKPRIG